ncbi:hypothetical protein Tco_1437247 [Tanacetum coccineum]
MLWHQNSGAKLHFADVAPLLEFGTTTPCALTFVEYGTAVLVVWQEIIRTPCDMRPDWCTIMIYISLVLDDPNADSRLKNGFKD